MLVIIALDLVQFKEIFGKIEAVNNMTQKISIKYNSNEENGMNEKKKRAKLMPIIGILEDSNISLDFLSK